MNTKLSTILALALMIGIISGLGFASILLRAESAEFKNSDDRGSEDKQESNNNSGDDKKSDDKEQEKEEPKEEQDKSDSSDSDDSRIINRDELKGTPEEQEEAAQEDRQADIDHNKPKLEPCKHQTGEPHNTDFCEPKKKWPHPPPDKCDHQCWPIKKHPIHRPHPNWCSWHDCHHHKHHTSTHKSDNHHGDVSVKVNLKYKEKNAKNLDDVVLIIGDVYDKTLDLSKKPDTVKVDHLDIDGGDDFAVCLANEDSQEGECTVAEADNDHDNVEVWLDVK